MISLKNMQDKETSYKRPNGDLDVIKIWKTIQGEGPFAGYRSIFVRLAGCNLQCPLCDTNYTDGRKVMTVDDIRWEISELVDVEGDSLIVLTGGEPFRQGISYLIASLVQNNFMIQIETNGTLYDDGIPWESGKVVPVCSPKTPQISQHIANAVEKYGYFKYVLEGGKVADDGLPTMTLGNGQSVYRPWNGFPRDRIFVQPLDPSLASGSDTEKSDTFDDSTKACIESCLKFGYRLGMQLHKMWGVE